MKWTPRRAESATAAGDAQQMKAAGVAGAAGAGRGPGTQQQGGKQALLPTAANAGSQKFRPPSKLLAGGREPAAVGAGADSSNVADGSGAHQRGAASARSEQAQAGSEAVSPNQKYRPVADMHSRVAATPAVPKLELEGHGRKRKPPADPALSRPQNGSSKKRTPPSVAPHSGLAGSRPQRRHRECAPYWMGLSGKPAR